MKYWTKYKIWVDLKTSTKTGQIIISSYLSHDWHYYKSSIKPNKKNLNMFSLTHFTSTGHFTIIAMVFDSLLKSQIDQFAELHDDQFGFRSHQLKVLSWP